jgi:Arc-like DNA binding domain
MARKLSDTVKLNLRFSEELRRKLEKAAERNNQSMNLEIVARLEASFRKEEIREIVRSEMVDFYEALKGNPLKQENEK